MSDVTRPRAIRLAFLVEAGSASEPILTAIIRTCYGFYGGRFAVVVPCQQGQISEAYWHFLEGFDPDLVYSYFPLTEELQSLIHERLYPAHLIEHWRSPASDVNDISAYRPNLPFQPLTSLSVIPVVARGDGFPAATIPFLIDGWQARDPTDFVLDNFGTRTAATGNWAAYQEDARLIRALSFVSADALGDPRSRPGPDDSYFEDDVALLTRLVTERIVGVAQLSARETRRLDYRDPRWTEIVTLFVGSGFDTRLAFWNCRHLMAAWLDGQLISWRVSPKDLSDDRFAKAFVEVVRRHSHVQSTGSGFPNVRIVTVMDDCKEGEAIAQRLQEATKWCRFSSLHLASLDECTPSRKVADKAYELEGGRYPVGSGTPWHVMTRTAGRIIPAVAAPQHMQYLPGELRHLRQGYFAVDCDLQRTNNLSMYSNVQDRWRLPRRLRMTDAFIGAVEDTTLRARASRGGLLTIFGTADGTPFELTEPDDTAAFHRALVRGKPWPLRRGNEHQPPEEIVVAVRPSDCGKALTGVIHQFDGLHRTQSYLLHQFWAGEFAELGATVTIHQRMVDDLSNKLRKHSSNSPSWDLRDAEKRRWLAEWALREASRERRAERYRRYDTLRENYREFCRLFAAKHPEASASENDLEYEAQQTSQLNGSLQYLCLREVLHQGYEWRCPRCLHKNWVGIDRLARELVCVVCAQGVSAPVEQPWQFRLNEFVHRAIRDQGVLPLVWALKVLQDQSMSAPMCFLGPSALYFDDDSLQARAPDAEADLLVVLGTELVLVEAKSSAREVRPDQLEKLANRIRPNRVVLAVMEPRSAALDAHLAAIRDRIKDLPTRVDLITADSAVGDDYPSLPAGPGEGTFRIRLI